MHFKAPNPTPKGLWRRVPPAVFPPILGLLGLSMAWRRGAPEFGFPVEMAQVLGGAVTLLAGFALLAFAGKIARRPKVLVEDLRILPGRAGAAASVLCVYLIAGLLAPFVPQVADGVLYGGLGLHAALTLVVVYVFATGPKEQRRVSPVFQLIFTGWIVAAVVATGMGKTGLAFPLFWIAMLSAVILWTVQMQQFGAASVPAPLRPLLAIHLAPAALLGTVAQGFNSDAIALVFAVFCAAILLAMIGGLRWLLAAGFSPMWGALTFPMAALANFWLLMGGVWRLPGGLVLVLATLTIPWIAFRILKDWASGSLAIKTNAAAA